MIPFFGDALICSLFVMTFAMAVVSACAVTEAKGDGLLYGFFAAAIAAAIASTGIGLVQWLRIGEFSHIEHLIEGSRIYANITQPNNLASLLALGVVGAVWLYESRHIGPWGTGLMLAFLGFGMVMTQSRTAWAFALCLALWALIVRSRLSLRTSRNAVAAALALFIAATALWQPLNSLLGQSLVEATAQRL